MKYTVIYIFIAVAVVVALAYFLMSNNSSCKKENDQCTATQDCCGGLLCDQQVCVTSVLPCKKAQEKCTATQDCCGGLLCTGGVCSIIKPLDMYTEHEDTGCHGYSTSSFTDDAGFAKVVTKQEFVDFVAKKCNKCRDDPSAYPECQGKCEGFVLFDDPNSPQGRSTWQNGGSHLCFIDGDQGLLPDQKGSFVYSYDPK